MTEVRQGPTPHVLFREESALERSTACLENQRQNSHKQVSPLYWSTMNVKFKQGGEKKGLDKRH